MEETNLDIKKNLLIEPRTKRAIPVQHITEFQEGKWTGGSEKTTVTGVMVNNSTIFLVSFEEFINGYFKAIENLRKISH